VNLKSKAKSYLFIVDLVHARFQVRAYSDRFKLIHQSLGKLVKILESEKKLLSVQV
jgi:hypothetical protein